MIAFANFEKYRKGDFYQFMVNTLQIVSPEIATNLSVAAQRTALETQVNAFNAAYTPVIGSETTPQLAALDTKRDEALIGIKSLLEGYVKHYDANVSQAAFSLLDIMEGYGKKIYLMRYQLETATISNLLEDWQVHTDKVTLLHLTEWVAQLGQFNTDFNNLYVARTQELAGLNTGALEQIRQDTLDAYRTLKSHIEAQGIVNPSAENDTVQEELTELVEQYNDAVNRYSGTDEEEENETPTEEDNTENTNP